jgi:hypothetical protein
VQLSSTAVHALGKKLRPKRLFLTFVAINSGITSWQQLPPSCFYSSNREKNIFISPPASGAFSNPCKPLDDGTRFSYAPGQLDVADGSRPP